MGEEKAIRKYAMLVESHEKMTSACAPCAAGLVIEMTDVSNGCSCDDATAAIILYEDSSTPRTRRKTAEQIRL